MMSPKARVIKVRNEFDPHNEGEKDRGAKTASHKLLSRRMCKHERCCGLVSDIRSLQTPCTKVQKHPTVLKILDTQTI